jgi:hypothetical protein
MNATNAGTNPAHGTTTTNDRQHGIARRIGKPALGALRQRIAEEHAFLDQKNKNVVPDVPLPEVEPLSAGPVIDESLENLIGVVDDIGPDTDPPGQVRHIDTAGLLAALEQYVTRYVVFRDEHQAVAVVLWILHAWSFKAWSVTPRLAIGSAEKGSGKTRLFEVLELVVPGPQRPANISPAAMFRIIEAGTVTLLIDEADTIFSPKATGPTEELRAILNAGYREGATVLRVEGDRKKEVKAFNVFAPVAIAGIGRYLPDTVSDRSIDITLAKRARHEHVERFRYSVAAFRAAELRDWAADWADRATPVLADTEPVYLDELADRQADSWTPLLAIADMAGEPWASRARAAAIALSSATDDGDELTIGVRLLADCRTVIGADERIATATLLDRLHTLDEAPWADWYGKPLDSRQLAKRLKLYGIRSRDVRWGTGEKDHGKGYQREDFADAWSRYLPPLNTRDIRDIRDNPSVATQDMSPMSRMSRFLEGTDDADGDLGARCSQSDFDDLEDVS